MNHPLPPITLRQRIFAENWPLKILLAAGAIACIYISLHNYDWPIFFPSISSVALIGLVVIVSAMIGCLIAVIVTQMVLPPIYRLQAKTNGAPFPQGSFVRILSGPPPQQSIARSIQQ